MAKYSLLLALREVSALSVAPPSLPLYISLFLPLFLIHIYIYVYIDVYIYIYIHTYMYIYEHLSLSHTHKHTHEEVAQGGRTGRYRANLEQISQSRPDSGLGVSHFLVRTSL